MAQYHSHWPIAGCKHYGLREYEQRFGPLETNGRLQSHGDTSYTLDGVEGASREVAFAMTAPYFH